MSKFRREKKLANDVLKNLGYGTDGYWENQHPGQYDIIWAKRKLENEHYYTLLRHPDRHWQIFVFPPMRTSYGAPEEVIIVQPNKSLEENVAVHLLTVRL